ncbi:MAG: hypothetical protein ABR592_03330, partial [Nitriliruptorales bacterium]
LQHRLIALLDHAEHHQPHPDSSRPVAPERKQRVVVSRLHRNRCQPSTGTPSSLNRSQRVEYQPK